MAASMIFLGDVMLGRLVDREIAIRPPDSFWGDTLPVLRQADAVFANLECAITSHQRPWRRTPKMFHFGARPRAVEVLKAANVRWVSLANNHILDFEVEGLRDTLMHLEQAGIACSGAGHRLADARRPAVVEVGGLRIACLAVTDNEPPFAAGDDTPGVWHVDPEKHAKDSQTVTNAIAAVRAEEPDLVVLSAHMGPNMVEHPSDGLRRFARAAVDAGVDLYHGHSAHIFQGVEPRGSGLILHDCGDVLDDYAVEPELHNDWSFLFRVTADADGLRELTLIPVKLDYAVVNLARGAEFDRICARMIDLSDPFSTRLCPTAEGLSLPLRKGAGQQSEPAREPPRR